MAVIIIILLILTLISLYLWAIMPGHRRPMAAALGEVKYYAHRGLHDMCTAHGSPDAAFCQAPENSLPAFARAIAAGYGIELDVRLTGDGQAVVFHDDDGERMMGFGGLVHEHDYARLCEHGLCQTQERMPLLADVLALVGGRVPLIIEYKIVGNDVSVCAVGDRLLRDYDGPYVIESFHPLALRWYRRHNPAVIRGQLADRFTIKREYRHVKYWLLQNLLLNALGRPDFIAYNHEYPGNPSFLICRRLFRCRTAAWTVFTHGELERTRRDFDWFIFEGFSP